MLARALLACTLVSLPLAAAAQSPYVGETSRAIKSLSSGDVADYLAGNGMGLAKAAELNGYPGPAHVLALAEPLALTDPQRADTQAVFARMQAEARSLGERLVAEERALDRAFADHTVTPDALARHDSRDHVPVRDQVSAALREDRHGHSACARAGASRFDRVDRGAVGRRDVDTEVEAGFGA